MVAVDAVAPDKAAVVAKFHPLLAHKGPCEADRLYVVPAVQLCNAIEMPGDQITTVKLVRSHCGLLGCLRQHLVNHSSRNGARSEEHTSELQSPMRISYAVFCLKKKKEKKQTRSTITRA